MTSTLISAGTALPQDAGMSESERLLAENATILVFSPSTSFPNRIKILSEDERHLSNSKRRRIQREDDATPQKMKLSLAALSALLGLAGSAVGVEMLATVDPAYLCPSHPFQLLSSSFKASKCEYLDEVLMNKADVC
jgi:hypothetical protein